MRVAIVGDGPSAATCGWYLARAGVPVVVFGTGKRPPLLVGESTVPAMVPILREMGIEDEIASFSTIKPGATFVLDGEHLSYSFFFGTIHGRDVAYAYNTPRDAFDHTVRRAAERAGVRFLERRVTVVPGDGDDAVSLDAASLAQATEALGGEPTFFVDATGRGRAMARLLDLPTVTGPRRDVSLFAHVDQVALAHPGHVHTDRLAHGWAWRIPLPGKASVGIVAPADVVASFGDTNEARFDAFCAADPWMRQVMAGSTRQTRVVRFESYQLTTLRGTGANWALVGDAFGFIDPVFSSGLFLAMSSGRALGKALATGGTRHLHAYERQVLDDLEAWRRIVSYYYDGRLFTLLEVGKEQMKNRVGRIVGPHIEAHIPRCFTGEALAGSYSRRLLDFLTRYAMLQHDPARLAVR